MEAVVQHSRRARRGATVGSGLRWAFHFPTSHSGPDLPRSIRLQLLFHFLLIDSFHLLNFHSFSLVYCPFPSCQGFFFISSLTEIPSCWWTMVCGLEFNWTYFIVCTIHIVYICTTIISFVWTGTNPGLLFVFQKDLNVHDLLCVLLFKTFPASSLNLSHYRYVLRLFEQLMS